MITTIKVNGSSLVIDLVSILVNPRDKMIAEWGCKLAEAERELIQAEAHYRAWRATFANEVCAKSKKGTPPEWRVRTKIESQPKFLVYKDGLAEAAYNVRLLSSIVDALQAPIEKGSPE